MRVHENLMRAVMAGALSAAMTGQANGQGQTPPSQTEGRPAKTPTYEVVSIRVSKGGQNSRLGVGDTPDGFWLGGLPLRVLVPDAYGAARDDQVTGWPGWALSTRFDIQAKMDAETADALQKLPRTQRDVQRHLMMQALLEDRFKLKVHHATAVRTTYELVVAKGGLTLKEHAPDSETDWTKLPEGTRPKTDWLIEDGKISGHAMPISILANHLQGGAVDAIVVDKTGLTGHYDVLLHWDPTDGKNPNATEPSIFTALQEQLGLQLKPIKTTVDTIVIDHLEMPSEN